MTNTIELTTRARTVKEINRHKSIATTTPCGHVTYLSIDKPEYQYANSNFLSYKIKMAVSLHSARGFMKECDDLLYGIYPDVRSPIMPTYLNEKGVYTIVGESRNKPHVIGTVRANSYVRLVGSLLPFDRNGRQGVNLRFTHVEAI